MLHLDLNRCFTFKSISYYDENNGLKFDPPVYEQRYAAVIKVLEHEYWRGKLKKVIDFGCAEMKLVTLLKRIEGIQHILEVDIDEELMKPNIQRVKPLVSDYIGRRKSPLRIDVYKGSVDTPTNCLKDTDAIIAIELIEHLEPDVFENVPYNIFGFIKPKIVVITTPNADFNVLFELTLPNGFRHLDHKFEWSRKQFRDWCMNICERYKNYTVSITGIGKGPPDKRQYGCVSQMAVFIRKDILGGEIVQELNMNSLSIATDKYENDYKLLYSVEFPYTEDNRDLNQKVLDEVKYHIQRYTAMGDRYLNEEKNVFEIPLSLIFDFVYSFGIDENELKTILIENNYNVEKNILLVENEEDEEEDDDDNDEREFYENYDDGEKSGHIEQCSDFDASWD